MFASLKRSLKDLFVESLGVLHVHELLYRRVRSRDRLIVLNLHRVTPEADPSWPPLTPELFTELLRFVSARFDVTTLGDLPDRPGRGGGRPKLVLSFDDGYYDFVHYAMPLLERFGLRANQNVIGEPVLSGRPIWNVELYDFVRQAPLSLLREVRVPGFACPVGDGAAERGRFGEALNRHLKSRSRDARAPQLDELQQTLRRCDFSRTRMMSAAEVKEAAKSHEIGCHSFSHESMGRESMEFFRRDLDESLRVHHDVLGIPIRVYAFPNGSYRPEHFDELDRRGVERVLLVDERLRGDAERAIPRITFHPTTANATRLQAVAWKAQLREAAASVRFGRG